MAELERLERALRKADEAGDTPGARMLAAAIRQERKALAKTPAKPQAELRNYEPGVVDNLTYAANSVGLPGNKMRRGLDEAGTLLRSATDSLLFGWGDEAEAAIGAATGINGNIGDYSGNLERRALVSHAARLRNPKAALLGIIGGAVAGAGGWAKAGLTMVKNAKTLPGMVLGGTVDGAGYGGLAGAGYATPGERGKGALWGAGGGGAIGAAAPVALAGGSKLGRFLLDRVTANMGKPSNQALARLQQAARQAGDVDTKLNALGPEGMLMDTLGPRGQSLARSAANISPEAREILETASTTRMAGQSDRLTDMLLKASRLAEPRTLSELQKAAQQRAQPGIEAAYRKARQAGYDIDLESFEDLMQADVVAKAYRGAQPLAKDRRIAGLAESGKVSDDALANRPSNLALLDETKKSLDAMAATARGEQSTNAQGIAGLLAKRWRERIDQSLPEYGGARDLARRRFKQEEAIELGAEGAKPRIPADFARRVERTDPAHQFDLAQGYAAGKIDQIENRRTTPGVVDTLFGPRRQQEALNTVFGPKAADVHRQIAAERAFGRTDGALKGNSSSVRQLLETGLIGAGAGMSLGGDWQSGSLGAAGALLARKGGGAAIRGLTARKEAEVAPLLAKLLIGRGLPKSTTRQLEDSPKLYRLLTRALSAQTGGQAGVVATGP